MMRSMRVEGPFSLANTLECGQAFRWKREGDRYKGVIRGRLVVLREGEGEIEYEMRPPSDSTRLSSYLRLDDNYTWIISKISRDGHVREAVAAYPGLRLLRQEPWECLVSYICSAWSSVERIKGTIELLSRRFGEQIEREEDAYSFPAPEALAGASLEDLRRCGLGYRSRYVKGTARMILDGDVDLEVLRKIDYGEAKRRLLTFPGVGEKVADCVLLFSLEKLEAFPIDVWVRRVMQKLYFGGRSVGDAEMRQFAAERFGKHAGYAQQFLYHYARSGGCVLR